MSIDVIDTADQSEEDRAREDSGGGEIRAGLLAIGVFFLGFVGWAAVTPLDAAVVASGVVVVSGNRQTVQHRDGGVISRLAIKEGDRVVRGQVLIELGAPELVAHERALLSQVVDLQMQRARLTAERGGARTLVRPPEWAAFDPGDLEVADAAFERHQREVGGGGAWSAYDARIVGYRGEIESIGRQEALLQEEIRGMRALADEEFAPETRLRALERALAELSGRRSELSAQIASTQQERYEELRRVDARLAELTPQMAGAREQLEQTRLRSPADGVVVGLAVHTVGGVVRPGDRLMDIVPEGNDLIIEAQIRPEDADDLQQGQVTEVRFTAFGGRAMPIVHGQVQQVSADRFTDERTGRPYFLIQVAVPPEEVEKLLRSGSNRRLRAGLSAEVVVPTRKRTALQYLLEPLNQTLWRSLREQ